MTNERASSEPDWYALLGEPPGGRDVFGPERIADVAERAAAAERATVARRRRIARVSVPAAVLLLLVLPVAYIVASGERADRTGGATEGAGWTPRSVYEEDGETVLQALPGGESLARTANGCWWNIHIPADRLIGRTIEVTAEHEGSGLQLTELPAAIVDESMAYGGASGMTRVSSPLELPLAGNWKFELTVDGELLGDVVLPIRETPWAASGTFELAEADGQRLIGTEGRIGLLSPGFVAGQTNGHQWLLWGDWEKRRHPERFQVVGVPAYDSGTQRRVEMLLAADLRPMAGMTIGDNITGINTDLTLPASGLWQLIAIADGRYAGSVFVDVRSTEQVLAEGRGER